MAIDRGNHGKALLDAIETILTADLQTELDAHNTAQSWALVAPVEYWRHTIMGHAVNRSPLCAIYIAEEEWRPSIIDGYDSHAVVTIEIAMKLGDVLGTPGADETVLADAFDVYAQSVRAVLEADMLDRASGTFGAVGCWNFLPRRTYFRPLLDMVNRETSPLVRWGAIEVEIWQRRPQTVTASAVNGSDFEIWIAATYGARPADTHIDNGDLLVVESYTPDRLYKRVSSTWQLIGSADGSRLTVAGIGNWTDEGDSIATGVTVQDTNDGTDYYWTGAAWATLEAGATVLQQLGAGVTGAQLKTLLDAGSVTVHEGSGYLSTSGDDLVVTLTPGQRFTCSFDISSAYSASGLASVVMPYAWSESGNGGADDWGLMSGIVADSGALDLATRLITYGGSSLSLDKWTGGHSRVDSVNAAARVFGEAVDAQTLTGNNNLNGHCGGLLSTYLGSVYAQGWSLTIEQTESGPTLGTRQRAVIQVDNRSGSSVPTLTVTIHRWMVGAV